MKEDRHRGTDGLIPFTGGAERVRVIETESRLETGAGGGDLSYREKSSEDG